MNSMPDWWRKPRRVSVVVDNPSWTLEWAERAVARAKTAGDDAVLVRDYADVEQGAVAVFLGCTGLASAEVLGRNRRNLVIHESDLPHGRGFAPMTWQILEGRSEIPVCLIEAADIADAGPIYGRRDVLLAGNELIGEVRAAIGAAYLDLLDAFLEAPMPPEGAPQRGEPTRYRRRTPKDSRLDPHKTIAEQFQLLRVVDNARYPAFFEHAGGTYVLRIERIDRTPGS
jgi:methionyl-tRNA formyltransferase